MKGRRQMKAYEFLKWLKDAEKELERIEMLWSAGIVKGRDERQYRAETEPFSPYIEDIEPIRVIRIIR